MRVAQRPVRAARAAAAAANRASPAAPRLQRPTTLPRLCVAAYSGSAGSPDPSGEGSTRSGAAGAATTRQDPVALAREAAKLRSQLHEVRRELALSRRELAAVRAASAGDGLQQRNSGCSALASTTLRRTLTEEFGATAKRRRRFRILALDGGGVRGLFTAYVLGRLIKAEPRLLDSVDLIAGTSTGAIIGMLLAFDKEPAEVAEIYRDLAAKIFDGSTFRSVSPVSPTTEKTMENQWKSNAIRSPL